MPKAQDTPIRLAPCPWAPPLGEQLEAAVRGASLPQLYQVLQGHPELAEPPAIARLRSWGEASPEGEGRRRILGLADLLGHVARIGLDQAVLASGLAIDREFSRVIQAFVSARTPPEMQELVARHRKLLGETTQLVLALMRNRAAAEDRADVAAHLERRRAILKTILQVGDVERGFWEVDQIERAMADRGRADLLIRVLRADPLDLPADFESWCLEALASTPAADYPLCHGFIQRRLLESYLVEHLAPLSVTLPLAQAAFQAAEAVHTPAQAPDHWAHLQIYAARLLRRQAHKHPQAVELLSEALQRLEHALPILNTAPDRRAIVAALLELSRTVLHGGALVPHDVERQRAAIKAARQANDEASRLLRDQPHDALWEEVTKDRASLRGLSPEGLSLLDASWQDYVPWWARNPWGPN